MWLFPSSISDLIHIIKAVVQTCEEEVVAYPTGVAKNDGETVVAAGQGGNRTGRTLRRLSAAETCMFCSLRLV
jgi:hypothetical protein